MSIKIIETNLFYEKDMVLKDHESRIIKMDSWEEYVNMYLNYNGEAIWYNGNSRLMGCILPHFANIYEIEHDEFHLTCRMGLCNDSYMIKLAYKILR